MLKKFCILQSSQLAVINFMIDAIIMRILCTLCVCVHACGRVCMPAGVCVRAYYSINN